MQNDSFNIVDIKAIDCMKEGWELIKNEYWLYFAITIVGLLIAGALPLVLVGPMLCGIYWCFLRKLDGGRPEFADIFKGFDFFLPSLIFTLILVGFFFVTSFIVIVIPSVIFAFALVGSKGKPDPAFTFIFIAVMCVVMFIFAVIVACIHALVVFAHLLIIDRKLSGWDALKLSAKASWANINGVAMFIVVQMLLSILGILAAIVGAYLVLPIIYAGTTVMYRKIFPALTVEPIINAPPSPANYPNAGSY